MSNLTEEQEQALRLANSGHNLMILGQCGTGKTHVLRRIIQELKQLKKVSVTSTTGIASLQLGKDATTLHHWCGIFDGRYTNDKLQELFDGDDKFASAKSRILETDCLVIDEIGMLSSKVFNMVEFVCRHVRKNNYLFGGLQIVACGDFKQLPPVPNYRLQDDGSHCFTSPRFTMTFPHHLILKQVVRQDEADLIKAVNELCDGAPSAETISLMKSLKDPLPNNVDVVQLYGTNFDASFINQQMLDDLDGEQFVFKATDEGKVNLLKGGSTAPKILALKEGAPVILIRNVGGGLFNGTRGKVHALVPNKPPVINFNGTLVSLQRTKFEIFDLSQNKVLAFRTQYPIILAYAMTVHRAQGQTLEYVQIDCSSFFAPGQMGVAVGRSVKKKNLRILNFNYRAAHLKHKESVYKFYDRFSCNAMDDLSCCRNVQCTLETTSAHGSEIDFSQITVPSKPDMSTGDEEEPILEVTTLDCPYDINEFFTLNKDTNFISCMSDDIRSSDIFFTYIKFLYSKVFEISNTVRTKSQQWIDAYSKLNSFILSDLHIQQCAKLFGVDVLNKAQNKFSSKLIFWLMEKDIQKKSAEIVEKQTTKLQEEHEVQSVTDLSSVKKSKLRYVAGCCIQKIAKKLCESVIRNLGKTDSKSRTLKNMHYKKQMMLKQFRINEDEISPEDDSLLEINFKQGQSRGLFIVSDSVLEFFIMLDQVVQKHLTAESFHLNFDNFHVIGRNFVDSDDKLYETWMELFGNFQDDEIEDEIFITFVVELFRDVTEYFLKISIADGLKKFKELVPRKKKQALRTKVAALGDRGSKRPLENQLPSTSSVAMSSETPENYFCKICCKLCEEMPSVLGEQSIGCDKCDNWFHYHCVDIQGNESFLKSKKMRWYCNTCSKKGKGRGKKK